MDPERNPSLRSKAATALWLTFIAGFVDIVGALTVYDIFSAHMTGTTVRLAQHLQQRDWMAAAIAGTVLGAFVAGSLVGRILIEAAARARLRSIAAVTLGTEAALLACVALGAPRLAPDRRGVVLGLLAMLGGAMGLQTATLTRIGPLTVHTTFVTGMLNKLAQLVSHWLFRTYDLWRGRERAPELAAAREKAARQARFIFSIWLLYLAGAALGTFASGHLSSHAFWIPFFMLLIALAVDLNSPLSIEEERDQSER